MVRLLRLSPRMQRVSNVITCSVHDNIVSRLPCEIWVVPMLSILVWLIGFIVYTESYSFDFTSRSSLALLTMTHAISANGRISRP